MINPILVAALLAALPTQPQSDFFLQAGFVGAASSEGAVNGGTALGVGTLSLGFTHQGFEAGLFGELGVPYALLDVRASFKGVGAFAGLSVSLGAPWINLELLLRGGAHWYSFGAHDSSPLPFLGAAPQFVFRFGGESVAFRLALGLSVDLDLKQQSFTYEGSIFSPAGPVTLGGVTVGAGPSIGISFR